MTDTLQPRDLADALAARAANPSAVPIAGGTDLMVDVNFGRRRPAAFLDLTRVTELEEWGTEGGDVVVGAGVTHARLAGEVRPLLPALGIAARTVGSPAIRNRGTVGGNVATASPAGDALPPLVAADARVRIASSAGRREVPLRDFVTGPKRTVLGDDELVTAVVVPAARGPQQFAKVGPRNAMVIAVCSFALVLDAEARTVGAALGSSAPLVPRASDAEAHLQGVLDEHGLWESGAPIPEAAAARFADLVSSAASPIDDVRGTGAYRRHALGVLARRTLDWCWREYRP